MYIKATDIRTWQGFIVYQVQRDTRFENSRVKWLGIKKIEFMIVNPNKRFGLPWKSSLIS